MALDRKLEIDQGLALARKVDKLRQTVTEEELNLTRFRLGNGKILLEEINILIRERDEVQDEIYSLKNEKETQKYYLIEEWESLKAKQDEIKLQEENLIRKSLDLEQCQINLNEDVKKMSIREEGIMKLIRMSEEKERKITERELKLSAYKQNITEGINKLR